MVSRKTRKIYEKLSFSLFIKNWMLMKIQMNLYKLLYENLKFIRHLFENWWQLTIGIDDDKCLLMNWWCHSCNQFDTHSVFHIIDYLLNFKILFKIINCQQWVWQTMESRTIHTNGLWRHMEERDSVRKKKKFHENVKWSRCTVVHFLFEHLIVTSFPGKMQRNKPILLFNSEKLLYFLI